MANTRLPVRKTYKLFINGQFPRSESGHSYEVRGIHVSRGSRKDLRDAIVAARKAQSGWQRAKPYLRGQILYRIAEMLETRQAAFVDELVTIGRLTQAAARAEVEQAIDRTVWYAGWADKFVTCFGSVNPVSAPYFNFTTPEPTGVVGVIAPEQPALLGFVSMVLPAIVTGNAVVAIAAESQPCSALSFAEVVATSDVPAGVVNILAGPVAELLPILAKHMDVNAVVGAGLSAPHTKLLREEASHNVKRVVLREALSPAAWRDDRRTQSPYWILDTVEMKTAWHPIGL